MLKKYLLLLLTIFTIICVTNICYASNVGNSVKNAVNSGTSSVVDGAQSLAESVRNGISHVENGIEDALTMDDYDSMSMRKDNVNAGSSLDYSATRAASTISTDNTTMWVWLILGVAAIVIVALVWYYGSQNRID